MPNEITINSPKINNLIRDIESGGIKIPPLQRKFVWKVDQIIELLESIYNDYPIGSILWWETTEKLPSERNIAGFVLPTKPESHPFYYVLDGQQRLSSLYGVFCEDRTPDVSTNSDYRVDASAFDISFDLQNKKFLYSSECNNDRCFPLKSLFKTNDYSDALIKATAEDKKTLQNLYEKFSNYEVPIIVTKKRELAEVGIIFERINNTGTKLDLFDLMVAFTWTKNFHLQEVFQEIHETLKEKNFTKIKNKILLQCISGLLKNSSKAKSITSIKGEEIRSNINLLKESLKKAVDYLSTELFVKSGQLLPDAHQIVPLCFFFSKITTPTAKQKKSINEWFWKTSFSQRYSASTDVNIDDDISNFQKLIDDEDAPVFSKLKNTINQEQLRETKFRKSNSVSRAFVVLLANRQPKNLINGSNVDTGKALSCFNQSEYHHVFPKNFLAGKSVNKDKIDSLCNFCLLPADANRSISDKAPSDYFLSVIPQDNFVDITESNLLPVTKTIYNEDSYDSFLQKRSEKIIEYIEKILN